MSRYITLSIGLKRKFSFSYFRENFAKIYFRFLRKKLTKSYKNNENFRDGRKQETGNIVKYLKMSNPDGASN
jgi:hypothetical protein